MKTINSFVLASFLITSSLSFAQDNKLDIGIEGGPSIISLRGNVSLNSSVPTIGLFSGMFVQYNFNKVLSLRTNIAYEQKGTLSPVLVNDNLFNVFGEVKIRSQFNYLTIPLLVRATVGQKIKYFVNAGPYYGYLINQKVETASTTIRRDFTDNTFFYNRADFGISTGVGISIPVKSRFAISAEIRHNIGLVNISNTPVLVAGTVKTDATNFIFGITYKLGKRLDASI